jgi:hypothetical protein
MVSHHSRFRRRIHLKAETVKEVDISPMKVKGVSIFQKDTKKELHD